MKIQSRKQTTRLHLVPTLPTENKTIFRNDYVDKVILIDLFNAFLEIFLSQKVMPRIIAPKETEVPGIKKIGLKTDDTWSGCEICVEIYYYDNEEPTIDYPTDNLALHAIIIHYQRRSMVFRKEALSYLLEKICLPVTA